MLAVASILLLLLTGCTREPEGAEPETRADVELPEWLDEISPLPGAEAAPTDIIEVHHDLRGEFEGVRMLINGVDVTAAAVPNEGTNVQQPFGEHDENTFEGEGLLSYDPNTDLAPVPIEPGQQTVTLERVRVPEQGAEMEVLDTFEWTFTVQ